MAENDRLKNIIRRVALGKQREFAEKCNLQPASVCRLVNGTYSMTDKYLLKICSAYPNINPDYLRGKSDIELLTDNIESAKDEEIARLKHENELLKWVIQQLGAQRIDK